MTFIAPTRFAYVMLSGVVVLSSLHGQELQLPGTGTEAGPIDLNVMYLSEGVDTDEHASVLATDAETLSSESTDVESTDAEESSILPVLFQLDQTTPLLPAVQPLESTLDLSPAAREFANTIISSGGQSTLLTRQRRLHVRSSSDVVFGRESNFLVTTDAGNLLKKSNAAVGVQAKSRSPIITETRIHGSTPGQLLASGSYWFPARQDLDTILSKIDSRIIQDVIIVKGPFASHYGPGFDFIDFQLLQAPRYENGYETHGSTYAEYKTNGEQWYGRKSIWGGSDNYGFRIGYGNRTGSDYQDGDGNSYLSSYKSQDVDIAWGYDFTPDRHVEMSYIWLEQNDVEIPTQLLDISHLRTHGFESTYVVEDSELFDVWTLETWYNQTKLSGNANSPAKRQAIPFLGQNIVSINSNAQNQSTGFSLYGDLVSDDTVTTIGADLRYLTQEVNQLSNVPGLAQPFVFGNNATPAVNTPVPNAYSTNPGLFIERSCQVSERWTVGSGGRLDLVEMNARTVAVEGGGLAGPLSVIGPNGEFPFVYNPNGDPILLPSGAIVPGVQAEYDDLLLGSFNRSFGLGSLFIDGTYEINNCWDFSCGFGYAMRAPTMTELYAFQHISTVFPQQTFSILFGNPNLKAERRYQINVGLSTDQQWFRARVNGFSAFIENYITYDLLEPDFYVYQTVNTDLATLVGFDFISEVVLSQKLTSFLTATYTEGRDRRRTSNPLEGAFDRAPNQTRSGVVGIGSEPLPNILPLEARLGFTLTNGCPNSRWLLEISSQIVDNQSKIARTLGELPTPGFTVWDIRGNWRATDHLTINAGVENFGDRLYRTHLDPAGRELRPFPFAPPGTESSLGTVFQPGANFYVSSELTY